MAKNIVPSTAEGNRGFIKDVAATKAAEAERAARIAAQPEAVQTAEAERLAALDQLQKDHPSQVSLITEARITGSPNILIAARIHDQEAIAQQGDAPKSAVEEIEASGDEAPFITDRARSEAIVTAANARNAGLQQMGPQTVPVAGADQPLPIGIAGVLPAEVNGSPARPRFKAFQPGASSTINSEVAVAEAKAAGEKTVPLVFPRPVNLTVEFGRVIAFAKGINEVPENLVNHWYLKAHGVHPPLAIPTAKIPVVQTGSATNFTKK